MFELAKEIAENARSKEEVLRIKRLFARRHGLSTIPSDAEILRAAKGTELYGKLREILRVKPVRTISGVAVVAVMTSPAPCPHGKCLPCPGGVEKNTPQSYVGLEPAAMRGRQHGYDAFKQVTARLRELESIGHDVSKVEIIVMGGTFPARDADYKEKFMLGIFNALNSFNSNTKPENDLERAKRKNERAKARCVGITFETRPDYAREEHIREMLRFGGTKVELGVQSLYDDVLERIKRGHGVKEVAEATRLLRDSAFKVGYHIMPGLPGSSFERDLRMFRELFENDSFKPDYLKIYPTLVVEGTELYEMWKRGEYEPYTTEEVVELIVMAKRRFPEWVRVQRIQRDIPVKAAIGLDKGNIRQLVHRRLKEMGYSCRCIRCREVGHKGVRPEEYSKAELVVREYVASGGKEFFISFEIPEYDALVGFVRLRFPKEPFIEVLRDAALIRELHVYGRAVPIGQSSDAFQHRGFGERLLKEAEEIAKEEYDRIAVISGVGVRDYYRKLGYRLRQGYMVKKL
ncbi:MULTISPECIES: tRNA uridine(34) 5-carboxymethylaminomethyl modification radical SAM/GNAT enzyme Elp3 [Archaeoglobus]|uniref:tRNA carboxymethyluridine synthase n=1 Tax=Archaeoglobus fulgidus DSM 8774 TaxID=1344584 RepID=A0A075WJE4_ARCFL|nr:MULTISPECIES: tRNA uridine(34) 5-carboxymethylaminomethyl modification radical SAM/GNAT enzyme Elp3 [Archaeoglobus]AIG99369.1 Histone acetyltransferase [Archaeoglobus fulgidus DSM 8774]MDI3497900.1 elongator complex protein 3 [Archaeoglobus sp.]